MKQVLEQPEFAARYLAAIVESSGDAIIGTDLEGTITSWNRGAEALYGYSQDEAIGQHVQLVIPESHDHASPVNAARVRQGERVEPFETVRLRKDGSLVEVSLAMSPIADADGRIIGLASVTRDISELRRAMAALEDRIAFEQLVIRISSEFINLDPADTDSGINKALADIGAFAGVDRSYVFLFSADRTTMDNTHEWCAPGITSQRHRLLHAPLAAVPLLAGQILRGEVAHVPSAAALAEYAPVDAAELRVQEIQALVLVPLISRDVSIGCLGFDSVRCEQTWSDDTIRLLTIVGQVFINALERKWAAEALREREL